MRAAGDRRTARQFLITDIGALAALCLLALCVGLLLNVRRRDPLPIRYVSAPARLQATLAGLAAAEPGGGPVAQLGLPAFQRMAEDRSALILDARPDVFYRAGHVPGAFNLARESFAADYQRLGAKLAATRNRLVIVYCADEDCPDSGLVASALKQLGFPRVADFAGGWAAWMAAGLPQEKQTPP